MLDKWSTIFCAIFFPYLVELECVESLETLCSAIKIGYGLEVIKNGLLNTILVNKTESNYTTKACLSRAKNNLPSE